MRLLFGVTTGDPPFLEQFLIGGNDTLRGYRQDRFPGRRMALLNTEIRRPIGKSLIGVLFTDAGDAWGGPVATNPNFRGDPSFKAHTSYGAGIRVKTPLGPLRLDYGIGKEGSETHFGIAHMF
jgi:outer membrane protein insertion porin family